MFGIHEIPKFESSSISWLVPGWLARHSTVSSGRLQFLCSVDSVDTGAWRDNEDPGLTPDTGPRPAPGKANKCLLISSHRRSGGKEGIKIFINLLSLFQSNTLLFLHITQLVSIWRHWCIPFYSAPSKLLHTDWMEVWPELAALASTICWCWPCCALLNIHKPGFALLKISVLLIFRVPVNISCWRGPDLPPPRLDSANSSCFQGLSSHLLVLAH